AHHESGSVHPDCGREGLESPCDSEAGRQPAGHLADDPQAAWSEKASGDDGRGSADGLRSGENLHSALRRLGKAVDEAAGWIEMQECQLVRGDLQVTEAVDLCGIRTAPGLFDLKVVEVGTATA